MISLKQHQGSVINSYINVSDRVQAFDYCNNFCGRNVIRVAVGYRNVRVKSRMPQRRRWVN